MRGVLLILDVFSAHDIDAPNKTAISSVSERNFIVTRHQHLYLPDGFASIGPFRGRVLGNPLAELFHPAILFYLRTFDRREFGEDFRFTVGVEAKG